MKTKIFLCIFLFSRYVIATENISKISIEEVDKLLKSKKEIYLFDANVNSTRTNVGIIPGARLVEISESFDLKKELPTKKNSKLIFYCANQMCTASHMAAERAISYGYINVSVMSDGIYGWQKAGKKLAAVQIKSTIKTDDNSLGKEIAPKVAYQLVESQKAIIVDVRENEERHEIINGSLWFPMSKVSTIEEWTVFANKLPKNKQIIVHCAAGFRSKKVSEKLTSEGYQSSYFKGPDQWRAEGLPLVKNKE